MNMMDRYRAAQQRRDAGDQRDGVVEVRRIETVKDWPVGEEGEPFWRIAIDGYCADFNSEEGANNFASAIKRLRTPQPAPYDHNQRIAARMGATFVPREVEPQPAPSADLVALLRKCRDQFAFYAENHRQKQTEDGDAKAQVNAAFANEITAALTQAEERG